MPEPKLEYPWEAVPAAMASNLQPVFKVVNKAGGCLGSSTFNARLLRKTGCPASNCELSRSACMCLRTCAYAPCWGLDPALSLHTRPLTHGLQSHFTRFIETGMEDQ